MEQVGHLVLLGLATGRYNLRWSRYSIISFRFGGETPSTAATEEWTGIAVQTKTVTVS
jgi:hypothetical protein